MPIPQKPVPIRRIWLCRRSASGTAVVGDAEGGVLDIERLRSAD
jgi:hypothetical protein